MGMNGMTTRQILWGLPRRKHVLSAYRAVVFVLVLEALMSIKHANRDAHATFTAVTKGIDPTHTTEAALITVEWLFGH
jgi:hypothetical protein